jgi:hypothetical protein
VPKDASWTGQAFTLIVRGQRLGGGTSTGKLIVLTETPDSNPAGVHVITGTATGRLRALKP